MSAQTCTCIGHTTRPGTWAIDIPDPTCPTHTPTTGARHV